MGTYNDRAVTSPEKYMTTKPHSNEEVANKLIEAGKQRADWFEPDAEVILASSAKAIVAKALAEKDAELQKARESEREIVENTVTIATFDAIQGKNVIKDFEFECTTGGKIEVRFIPN